MSTPREKKSAKNHAVKMPVLPLREVIIFPHMVVPLFVGREKSINALEECVAKKQDLFLVAQRQATVANPEEKDVFQVGTIGTILQILRLPDNTVKVLVEGKSRGRILHYHDGERMVDAEIEEVADIGLDNAEVEALVRSLKSTFENYVKLNKRIPPEMLMSVNQIDDPSRLVDVIVAHLSLKLEDKQNILELFDIHKRLETLLSLMQGEIEILQVERRIRTRVKKQMEKSQKEYYLNEQMQAIQKELGEKDEFKAEIAAIEKQVSKKELSKEAREKVNREIKKLKMMSPMSAEATVVRNYIDWIVSLPWGEYTSDRHDLKFAKNVLEDDHYGLEEVKERILEYLSVRKLTGNSKGQILCFAGPPGVGKTSLAKSIAQALDKKVVRCSLGGVRDEAEIRGHRRTYVGALPGKIIQSLKKAGSSNPVFLLDEVDKMSMDFRGDPSSALLEVLDPEQNHNFGDHYLEIDYDLSKVMFILTANSLGGIPRPLLDRMEVITISGYTEIEKYHIVKKYLIKKQLEAHGLKATDVTFTDEAVRSIIHQYTKEAGVRNLERQIANVCRKAAKRIVDLMPVDEVPETPAFETVQPNLTIGSKKKKVKSAEKEAEKAERLAEKAAAAKASARLESTKAIVITPELVEEMLGPPRYSVSKAEEFSEVGLTNGLAYTEVGGDLLQIEVQILPGKGAVKFTGKLGDVMQESAQTAMTYVRSRAEQLGLEKEFYQNIDIHLHVPEGSTPKDGPSAGITMATAITSALTRLPVRKDLAMTGEITLRGRVLPIGGLKEKLLAAKMGDIRTVLIPKQNLPDIKKIPKEILEGLEIIPVEHADEVLRVALVHKGDSDFLKEKPDQSLLMPGVHKGAPKPVVAEVPVVAPKH